MKRLIYLFLLLPLLFAACSADEPVPAPSHPAGSFTIPITVTMNNGASTRLGDPGIDDELPPPGNVYVFVWKKCKDANTDRYEFMLIRKEDIAESAWTPIDMGNATEERYRMEMKTVTSQKFTPATQGAYNENEVLGRAYAIATHKDRKISEGDLLGMVENLCNIDIIEDATLTNNVCFINNVSQTAINAFDTKLEAITLDCGEWTTEQLRDLYSSPIASDGRVDNTRLANGVIIYNSTLTTGAFEVFGDIRMYHAAAKVDFKWEVPATLQDKIAVKKITTKNLPTTCKIFEPTDNPTTTTNHYVIGGATNDTDVNSGINHNIVQPINPGNKWIGREYFYALQPPTGTITYDVEFEDINANDSYTKSKISNATFTATPLSNVFTGWYRINATITE